jgi:hypothetical protein
MNASDFDNAVRLTGTIRLAGIALLAGAVGYIERVEGRTGSVGGRTEVHNNALFRVQVNERYHFNCVQCGRIDVRASVCQ